jgi:hypothetical protein
MNRHAGIIEGLGGTQRVASLLRLNYDTVRKWKTRGIPWKHWHRIQALAPQLTADYLDRTKPVGVQAKRSGRAA